MSSLVFARFPIVLGGSTRTHFPEPAITYGGDRCSLPYYVNTARPNRKTGRRLWRNRRLPEKSNGLMVIYLDFRTKEGGCDVCTRLLAGNKVVLCMILALIACPLLPGVL